MLLEMLIFALKDRISRKMTSQICRSCAPQLKLALVFSNPATTESFERHHTSEREYEL